MKSLPLSGTFLILSALIFCACSRERVRPDVTATPAAPSKPAAIPKRYPLTGRVVSLVPDKKALLVANDDMPGFMPAMTMQYDVDDATLKAATKDAHVTAELVTDGDTMWLEKAVFVPRASP
jgi:protein SCO1/2